MARLFNQFAKRKYYSLDGVWDIKFDPKNIGLQENWHKQIPIGAEKTLVPSCFNMELGNFYYEGFVWYFKKFTSESNNIKIEFGGISGEAKVYLDGKLIAEHYGEFTKFNFVSSEFPKGEHLLCVKCDNISNNEDTIPQNHVDWYHYGGIIRPISVFEFEKTCINDINISYTLDEKLENANLKLFVELKNFSTETISDTVKIFINDELIAEKNIEYFKSLKVDFDIELNNIKLWDIHKGNLYNIRFETNTDDICEKIGFRKIEARDQKIYLNNKEITIKGVNRHDEHADWGFAVPHALQKRDMQIIKNMNCNAIRCSHYPQSDFFLDLCDSEGILIWEEIPMWGIKATTIVNELFSKRAFKMTEEMMKTHINHPSIIIWGQHNECQTDTVEFYNFTKKQNELMRSIDNTRLITFASNISLTDICMEFSDIISVNKYIGWYQMPMSQWEDYIKELNTKLKNENAFNKPVIMSEFGAGGIAGHRTFENQRWTENYQTEYLEYTLNLFKKTPNIVGTYIWQYCDIRTASENELGRPRSFNNKGLVDEYRRPKEAYHFVKEFYGK